jgi:hypothetical protein
LVSQ